MSPSNLEERGAKAAQRNMVDRAARFARRIERRRVTDEREYIAEGVGSRVLNRGEEFLCGWIF